MGTCGNKAAKFYHCPNENKKIAIRCDFHSRPIYNADQIKRKRWREITMEEAIIIEVMGS
jgi:hypothetical protein